MAAQDLPDQGRWPLCHDDFKLIVRKKFPSSPKNFFPVPLNVHFYHHDWVGCPADYIVQPLLTDHANIFRREAGGDSISGVVTDCERDFAVCITKSNLVNRYEFV